MQIYSVIILFDHMLRKFCSPIFIPAVFVCVYVVYRGYSYVCMYVCVCVYVCMYVCVCVYVCMYVFIYLCMYACRL